VIVIFWDIAKPSIDIPTNLPKNVLPPSSWNGTLKEEGCSSEPLVLHYAASHTRKLILRGIHAL
jgi:hypothetical protein